MPGAGVARTDPRSSTSFRSRPHYRSGPAPRSLQATRCRGHEWGILIAARVSVVIELVHWPCLNGQPGHGNTGGGKAVTMATILVIDDNLLLCDLLQDSLSQHGH